MCLVCTLKTWTKQLSDCKIPNLFYYTISQIAILHNFHLSILFLSFVHLKIIEYLSLKRGKLRLVPPQLQHFFQRSEPISVRRRDSQIYHRFAPRDFRHVSFIQKDASAR
jgi:hypothetical protein